MAKTNYPKQMYIVLLVVFLGFVGSAMPYPIFAPLFLHPAHGIIVPENWGLQSRSIFLGVTLAAFPFGQFIGSPILGVLSDQYGRRRILFLTLLATTLGYFLTAVALSENILWLLIACRFLTGAFEGNISIARSIAVDLTPESKHKSFGQISAMAAVGYIFGPLMGGVLADPNIVPWFNFALPFYLATVFALLTAIATKLFLKESIRQKKTKMVQLKQQMHFIKRLQHLSKNAKLKHLLIASTILTVGVDSFYEFSPAYLTGLWHLTTANLALYTLSLSIGLALAGSWLVPRLATVVSCRNAIIASIPLFALTLILMLLTQVVWYIMPLFALAGISISIATTNLTVQTSNAAGVDTQGEVMGVQFGLRMLGDALLCLLGGVSLLLSVSLPLIFATVVSLIALYYYFYTNNRRRA